MIFRVNRPQAPGKSGLAIGHIMLCAKAINYDTIHPALVQANILSKDSMLEPRFLGITKRATANGIVYYIVTNRFLNKIILELWEVPSIPADPPKSPFFPYGFSSYSNTTGSYYTITTASVTDHMNRR